MSAELIVKAPSFIDSFEKHVEPLFDSGPDFVRSLRLRAWKSFLELGIPSTKHEEYKYTPLRGLADNVFSPAEKSLEVEDSGKTIVSNVKSTKLFFVNGYLVEGTKLPDGIIALPLDRAITEIPEEIEKVLGKIAPWEKHSFVALNTAHLEQGIFIKIPKNTEIEEPIQIVFLTKGAHEPVTTQPRVVIVVEPNSKAEIIESYIGEGLYFTNSVSEVVLAENAQLEHTKIQDESTDSYHLSAIQVVQHANSTYLSHNIAFGGALARTDLNVFLDGQGCHCWLNGVYFNTGERLIDNHTRIDHAKPECNSFEVYKGILAGHSTGVFNGKIFVHKDAQKTDAKQTNQALLLHPAATVFTKPQLEIFADDVKCTHGVTVGRIQEDAMFYLRARGIPKHVAAHILVYAFASEVLEKISNEELRLATEKVLFDRLEEAYTRGETEDLWVTKR
ncbi:MAG TPA: Fe-S cluster assembly protein SufD [Fimbriimonadales bacterium]|nr:Fe-S cluster assembly protein SufD [Fimbriimonadales bacterium]